jgi:hypothetical protein
VTRNAIRFSILACIFLSTAACDESAIEPGTQPLFRDGVNSITVMVYDAMTGAGVQEATVFVRVGPYTLPGNDYENVYTVAGIPQGTFPVFIDAPGYLPFVGKWTFQGTGTITNPNQARRYYTVTAIMFPLDSVEEDVELRVYEGETGDPVAGGRVIAAIDPTVVPQGIVTVTEDVLVGTLGLRPMSLTVDLSDGRAVFPRDELVFGATYRIDVIGARNADGDYLQPIAMGGFRAGRDHPRLVMFMGPPAVTPVALSASSETTGTFSELIVRFPYPMEVCSDPRDHGWVNESGDTNFNGEWAQPDAEDPLTVALSEGDEVLALTPNIAAGTDDDGDALTARITGVAVRVQGTRGSTTQTCIPLGQVPIRNTGTLVNPRVVMRTL